jgi:hypothetical protein
LLTIVSVLQVFAARDDSIVGIGDVLRQASADVGHRTRQLADLVEGSIATFPKEDGVEQEEAVVRNQQLRVDAEVWGIRGGLRVRVCVRSLDGVETSTRLTADSVTCGGLATDSTIVE